MISTNSLLKIHMKGGITIKNCCKIGEIMTILAFYGQRVGRHLEFTVHGRIINYQNGLVVENTNVMRCCNANLVQNC